MADDVAIFLECQIVRDCLTYALNDNMDVMQRSRGSCCCEAEPCFSTDACYNIFNAYKGL